MSYVRSFFQAIALSAFLASAPVSAGDKCDTRPYRSDDARLDHALQYFCSNTDGGSPVELEHKGTRYTIKVKTVTFGGGGDEYIVTITRKDRRKKETFVEGDFNAKLNNGAMFATLQDSYTVRRKGKEPEELDFDEPIKNDNESGRAYQKRVRKFRADTKWANRRYDSTLSELERILRQGTNGKKRD